jgi:hypothetical protein
MNVLGNKIFIKNTGPGNHTNGCVGGHRTEIDNKNRHRKKINKKWQNYSIHTLLRQWMN